MLNVTILNMEGIEVGKMELEASIFGIIPNEPVMHDAVVNYLANKRRGTQSALTTSSEPYKTRYLKLLYLCLLAIQPWSRLRPEMFKEGSTLSDNSVKNSKTTLLSY
ncbi:hypothetical protein J2TS6_14620 [Paenibacillus albilobatus]|uniref:50S ribosomal protein L4 n=1 Tax=Paenibacillus albilobatus TaxID=2716884 RepID=A0A919XCT5_9BACL|nr:hypothetical protein J2TS6_14620 [Paenibacillus albilobatus]